MEQIEDPLNLERWASSVLARTWERRRRHHDVTDHDPGFALGASIVEAIADVGSQAAKVALLAIAELSDDDVGRHAAAWARQIDGVTVPDWIAKVGEAKVIRAVVVYSPCEAEAIFIEAEQPSFGLHTVCVYIDHYSRGAAKHLGLLTRLDSFASTIAGELPSAGGPVPVEPQLACRRIRDAIWLTDDLPGVDVGDDYADLRALALSRAFAGPVVRPKPGKRRAA